MGRFPGPIGLPGLRWFDRAREVCTFPDYTRSYVGYQMGAVDRDIDADAPTIFELCDTEPRRAERHRPRAAEAQSHRLDHAAVGAARRAHALRRQRRRLARRSIAKSPTRSCDACRDERPEFVFAALTGVDKVSHARGQDSPMIMDALAIVDDTAARIRADAERDGRWDDMSLWIVSDHGHSRVTQHEDLVRVDRSATAIARVSHPWVLRVGSDVAVMVSGNAMAHLYLELPSRTRRADALERTVRAAVQHAARAAVGRPRARAARDDGRRALGDARRRVGVAMRTAARITTAATPAIRSASGAICTASRPTRRTTRRSRPTIPDSVVQIVHLALAPRSGEIILSAARDWDFRARYEPIPHVSSHGALHREHMLVPLLTNRPVRGTPRRTVDVMPSALAALGKAIPPGLDGESFL